ncbi:MAG: xanthine dehydrogenase family protein subunit M [Deltaproteobacteria bacterium]|nr:xanthine dehydrogenase family protein subunit M [Deltaproteobacteria bacterium]
MIHDFTYLRPGKVKEALAMLAQHRDGAKIICGGQSLLIIMRQGLVVTEFLVDIKGLDELNFITYDPRAGLKIGATTTHRTIEKSPLIKEKYPVLAAMEEKLASIQVRNWGTIGGNLAHADAAGDPAPVLIALNASVTIASSAGVRSVPLEEFYPGLFETVLAPDEMVTEVLVPPPSARTAAAYQKFNLLESDQGIVAVAVSLSVGDGGVCKDARIVLGNAAPVPIRAKKTERLLIESAPNEEIFAKAGETAAEEADPVADIHASEDYRRHLIAVLTGRLTKEAWEQACQA